MLNHQSFSDNWSTSESLPTVHHRFGFKLPGITEESRLTTLELLKRNHDLHHCFFNERNFHNHLIHHLLAAFSLGAPPKRLEEIYKLHSSYQNPIGDFSTQTEITEDNWHQFLGRKEYYGNYLRFWTREVKKKGVGNVLSSYLFDTSKEGTLDFFSRFMGGAFHPFIHVGYGLEFSLGMIVAEGLSMGSVTSDDMKPIFLDPPSTGPINTAIQALTSLTSTFGFSSPATPPPNTATTALSILELIHSDHSLDNVVKFEDDKTSVVLTKIPERVKEYAKMWPIDSGIQEDVTNKTKELMSAAMALYAGSTRPGNAPKLDFFLMHVLTSSFFLPIFLSHLSLEHSTRLLQAYFSATITFYISQGRPRLHLVDNLSSYKSIEEYNDNSNPWLKIIDLSISHEDEHVVKALRTLIWGGIHLTQTDSNKTNEKTGLSPFSHHYWLNSAKLTLDTIRGENWWNHSGIGFDETWNGGKLDIKPDLS